MYILWQIWDKDCRLKISPERSQKVGRNQFYSGSSMTRIFKYREMASTNDYNLKVKDHKMRAWAQTRWDLKTEEPFSKLQEYFCFWLEAWLVSCEIKSSHHCALHDITINHSCLYYWSGPKFYQPPVTMCLLSTIQGA